MPTDTNADTTTEADIARFMKYVEIIPFSECWWWVGWYVAVPSAGSISYGGFRVRGKSVRAHRWFYEVMRGVIPAGLELDHLCRNPACVRPDHLEAVTGRVNTLRSNGLTAIHARKTHCIHGHEFTPENTHILPNGIWRSCRACKRDTWRRLTYGVGGSSDTAKEVSSHV